MIKQRFPCHGHTLKASFFTSHPKTFLSNSERRNFATLAAAKSSPIFVAGADGVIAIRIVKKLLDSGYKVSAGVKDDERAEMLLNFMKKYGILKKSQLSNLTVSNLTNDDGAIDFKLPKSGKVICIEGDVIGRQTTDSRYISNVIEACQEKSVSEVAFVTSKRTGGGFFSFFTGGNASSSGSTSLSRTEKMVADSGINYTIIRSSNTNVPDSFGEISNVVVGQQGSFKSGQITKNQVADTVESVLNCEYTDFVMEVKGEVDAENVPIGSQIDNLFEAGESLEAAVTTNAE